MGKLHSLEVENFKSYKGRQLIGPFYRFTAVIGPNGAGKSNLMDAISFVLGMRSDKLRSTNLKDLIYRGLQDSQAPEDSPTSAYVKMNYDQSEGGGIKSNGTSEYFIDEVAVTCADYNRALESEGILAKACNALVFQGDVEKIASQSPKDMTRLIEQISGSIEYKEDYENLKLLQEQTTEDSAFNYNKKRSMAVELKQFQEQKKEAERYDALKAEKQGLVVQQILWKLYHTEARFLALEEELEHDDAGVAAANEELKREEEALKTAKADQSRCQLEVKKFEGQVRARQAELERKQPEALTCEENLTHAAAKLEKMTDNAARLTRNLAKQDEIVNNLRAELAEASGALERHKEEARRLQAQTLSEEELAEYKRINHEFVSATFELRQELERMERPERALRDQVERAQQNLDSKRYTVNHLENVQAEQAERLATLEASLTRAQEETAISERELAEAIAERLRLEQREKEANERLSLVLNDLVRARMSEQASSREKKLREGLETLKRMIPGVHGRVLDVIRPSQQRYETAILTILANNLDAVIVDQQTTALECIKFLKDQHLGSAKFLPLDTVVVQPIPDRLRHLDGARLGIDVIQFDPRFERAIQYATGSALVCDTLAVAKRICFVQGHEVKAVSLDGTVIHRNGNITGGGAKVAGAAKAARQWEEKKLDELRTERDHLLAQLNEIQRAKSRGDVEGGLRSKIKGLKANLEFLTQEKSKADRNVASAKQELALVQQQLQQETAAATELTAKLEAASAKSNELRDRIAARQDSMFADLVARLGIPTIRYYEERQLQTTKAIVERNLKFQATLTKLENQLGFEEGRLKTTQQSADQLTQARSDQLKTHAEAKAAKQAIESAVARVQADLAKANRQLTDALANLATSTTTTQERQRARDLAHQELGTRTKAVVAKESLLSRYNSERQLLLRRCKLEEIALPLNMGDLDKFESERPHKDMRTHSSHWAIEVDYETLPQSLRDNSGEEVDQDFDGKLTALSDEMDRMAPYMKARDKLGEVQRRALESQRDFSQSRSRATDAKARFNEVKLKRYALTSSANGRYQRFYAAFEHIAHAINDIYKELTRNPAFPMGGPRT
ncbi:Structural maintenance of chromosomes protein 1 [Massospora cicadina]|nr:Structural maintenance of chromosomes protein 1 [Massospora cicadina]